MFVNQNRMRASNFVLFETRSDTLLTKEMSLFNRGNFFYLNMNSYRMMDIFSQFILVIIILHFNLNHLNEMIKCTLDLKMKYVKSHLYGFYIEAYSHRQSVVEIYRLGISLKAYNYQLKAYRQPMPYMLCILNLTFFSYSAWLSYLRKAKVI